MEQFDDAAFSGLIAKPDVVALRSHQDDRPLRRVSNRTLRVKPDAVGIWYTIVPDPSSRDGQEQSPLCE
ncbi:HK97 family phage prohead protease [Bradyrhizobium sp. CW4]|nr:HK97 family phage prohead protease [Bradyrhizobium sp. CW4]